MKLRSTKADQKLINEYFSMMSGIDIPMNEESSTTIDNLESHEEVK